MYLTKNFDSKEFACKCGKCDLDGQSMPLWFVNELQALRDEVDIPLIITSGIRCEAWNAHEGGKFNSAHLRGMAADIEVLTSKRRFWIIQKALALRFTRIGIGREFVHLDKDAGLPQNVVWVYATYNPTTL